MGTFLALILLHCVCSDKQIAKSAFIKRVKATTHIKQDGRICVQMPWKPGFPDKLPNNYYRVEEQMRKRENELAKNGKLYEYYKDVTNSVERWVVRILSQKEASKAAKEPVWHLNHQIVEQPYKSSSKLHLVFDSAAPYMGIYLNDALE